MTTDDLHPLDRIYRERFTTPQRPDRSMRDHANQMQARLERERRIQSLLSPITRPYSLIVSSLGRIGAWCKQACSRMVAVLTAAGTVTTADQPCANHSGGPPNLVSRTWTHMDIHDGNSGYTALHSSTLIDGSFITHDDDDAGTASISGALSVSDLSAGDVHGHDSCSVNPANGLPMCGSVDIEGNAYGTDSHHNLSDSICDMTLDGAISGFGSDRSSVMQD